MSMSRRHLLAGAAVWAGLGAAIGVSPVMAQDGAALPRVLAFGDSLTAGYGLRRAQGLVPQLGRWLAQAGRPAQVLNGGLSGDTTATGRVRLPLSLARNRPDAVIVALGGNDMLLRRHAPEAEANLDAILTRAGAGGRPLLLVGIHAPQGDAGWRRDWAAIWPRLAQRHDALLLPDLYAPLAAVPAASRAPLLLADGVHPSAQGVSLLVGALGPMALRLIDRLG